MAVNAVTTAIATNQSSYITADYKAEKVVDWSGMTGTYGDPAATSSNHATAFYFWHSANATPSTQWLSFDFGSVLTLDGIHYWNGNQGSYSNRGINLVNIQTSTNGIDWTTQFTTNFQQASGLTTYAGTDYDWAGTMSTRYVRFDVESNHGGGGYTTFSEVVFYSAIPEPATVAGVLCLGLPAILRRRRNRRM